MAVLAPPPEKGCKSTAEVIEQFREFHRGGRLGDDLTARDLTEEGRRW